MFEAPNNDHCERANSGLCPPPRWQFAWPEVSWSYMGSLYQKQISQFISQINWLVAWSNFVACCCWWWCGCLIRWNSFIHPNVFWIILFLWVAFSNTSQLFLWKLSNLVTIKWFHPTWKTQKPGTFSIWKITFIRMMSLFCWGVNHHGSMLPGDPWVGLVGGETPMCRMFHSIRGSQPMAKLMVRLLRFVSRWVVSLGGMSVSWRDDI